jgi:hypothetical protein
MIVRNYFTSLMHVVGTMVKQTCNGFPPFPQIWTRRDHMTWQILCWFYTFKSCVSGLHSRDGASIRHNLCFLLSAFIFYTWVLGNWLVGLIYGINYNLHLYHSFTLYFFHPSCLLQIFLLTLFESYWCQVLRWLLYHIGCPVIEVSYF